MNREDIHHLAKFRAADLKRHFGDAVPTSTISKAREAFERIAEMTAPPPRFTVRMKREVHDGLKTFGATMVCACVTHAQADLIAELLNAYHSEPNVDS